MRKNPRPPNCLICHKDKKLLYDGLCTTCHSREYRRTHDRSAYTREYHKKWRRENPEKYRAQRQRYYQKHIAPNLDAWNAYQKEWRKTHPEAVKKHQRKSYYKHRDKRIKNSSDWKKNNPEKAKIHKIKGNKNDKSNLRHDVLSHYSNGWMCCVCCGEGIERFLTIDDVAGNHHLYKEKHGSGIRFYRWLRTNNYPKGYQVLCFNCNSGRACNDDICPHVELRNNETRS